MRLLLVEDNSTTQEALEEILKRAGHEIEYSGNGLGALIRLQISLPDAILADWFMPGMDGLTLLREIRSIPEWKYLPVIFTTAASEIDSIVGELHSLNPVVILRKPFDIQELLCVLEGIRNTSISSPSTINSDQ